jgi:hypothetical protein
LEFDLMIEWAGGRRRQHVSLTERSTGLVVVTPAPVESILIDPDESLLFIGDRDASAAIQPPGPERAYREGSGPAGGSRGAPAAAAALLAALSRHFAG